MFQWTTNQKYKIMKYYVNVVGYAGNCEYMKLCHKVVSKKTFEMYEKHYKDKKNEANFFECGNVKSVDIYI